MSLVPVDPNATPTPPKVKVLPPSKYECRNKKNKEKKKKTLVCVASGFYPDHVSVSWDINGDTNITDVATDNAALYEEKNKTYSITSRLRVSAEEWFTKGKNFTCTVSYTDEKTTTIHSGSIQGVQGARGMFIIIWNSQRN